MAQASVSLLNFLSDGEDDDVIHHQNAVVEEDVHSPLSWPLTFGEFHLYPAPDPSVSRRRPQISSRRTVFGVNDDGSMPHLVVTTVDRENQVNFVMDLFHQRVEQSQSSTGVISDPDLIHDGPELDACFGVIEGNEFMGLNSLDEEFGLGLGFCERADNSGFHVEDCDGPEQLVSGLSVVDAESDSDPDENCIVGRLFNVDEGDGDEEDENSRDNESDDPSLHLCWGSFQLEDHRDVNEDFEWEEIDGRVDEREILSMFLDEEEEVLESAVREDLRARELENLEWEFLLNVQNMEPDPEIRTGEFDLGLHIDQDDNNYTTEYEHTLLFGQFTEGEIRAIVGRPPASKTVIRDLPTVAVSKDDLENNNATCAICKDDMNLGEKASQLPCAHRYHGDCILPWLDIRNTCPVCRYELPTDDSGYESTRRVPTQRVGQLY